MKDNTIVVSLRLKSHPGAIVGWEGGTQAVVDVFAQLQAAHVPVVAFWLQDWSGKRVSFILNFLFNVVVVVVVK